MLHFVAWVLRVEGWAMLLLGLILAVVFAVAIPGVLGGGPGGILGGPFGAFITLLFGLGVALWLALPIIAAAELIFVLIQIEKNTHDAVDALKRRDQ